MAATKILFRVRDYDLAATLDSGQAFRWQKQNDSWIGIIGRNWVRLMQTSEGIFAETAELQKNWKWLRDYLQIDLSLAAVLKTFPDDAPMRDAVAACRGLRVLRQEPWECLASFILSSTKQIVQIRQIVSLLCERFGERLAPEPPASCGLFYSFPSPQRIAAAGEAGLRACKMGFRAPHLLGAARQIAEGKLDLEKIRELNYSEARAELMKLRGVGGKIADCVLLFACGFDSAFPVDVWVERALQKLYFPRRRATQKRLRHFAATHFGPHAGYAQQYLFHFMRTKAGQIRPHGQRPLVFASKEWKIHGVKKNASTTDATTSEK
ncbi:MAG TPA: DNA glycosylase [Candidatus Baltobacteraceae bacterium]|nr:DNA glycosylase [Candidatus Baltobacteraceae bacterium]